MSKHIKQDENFPLLEQVFKVLLNTIKKPDIPKIELIIGGKKELLSNYKKLEENFSNTFTRLNEISEQFYTTLTKILDELFVGEYEKLHPKYHSHDVRFLV